MKSFKILAPIKRSKLLFLLFCLALFTFISCEKETENLINEETIKHLSEDVSALNVPQNETEASMRASNSSYSSCECSFKINSTSADIGPWAVEEARRDVAVSGSTVDGDNNIYYTGLGAQSLPTPWLPYTNSQLKFTQFFEGGGSFNISIQCIKRVAGGGYFLGGSSIETIATNVGQACVFWDLPYINNDCYFSEDIDDM